MKRGIFLCVTVLMAVMLIFAGCGSSSVVRADDLSMVNQYIREQGNGAKELTLQQGESVYKLELFENKETGEMKRSWELVVDYVRNEQSEAPAALDYRIEFDGGSFSLEDNVNWVSVGG